MSSNLGRAASGSFRAAARRGVRAGLAAVCLFIMQASARAAPADFHVAPAGDDANPGTRQRPFATITRARDEVRRKVAGGLRADITVLIRGGTYRVREPIVFGPEDSGAGRHSITYAACPGEKPVISGGRVVTGWRDRGDGTWIANLPEVKAGKRYLGELFVNGRRAVRARHPNSGRPSPRLRSASVASAKEVGYLRVENASRDRMSHFTFKPGDIPERATAEGTDLVFIHDWSISRIPVKLIDHAGRTLTPAAKIGRQHGMMVITGYERHARYFLENHPAFLDDPGEWCLLGSGELIYRPRPGETIAKFEAVVPVARRLLVVRGAGKNRPVRNLRFVGLTFEHCRFPLPEGGYAGVQATFHPEREGQKGWRAFAIPALQFEQAESCRFEDGAVRHVGGSGIAFASRCRGCVLVGSAITDVGGNGVMIGEDRGRQVGGGPWWQSAPGEVASGNVVRNNLIERCGARFFGAVGVWVGFAEKTAIARNEIRHTPYTGVSVGWLWNPSPTPCRANVVEYNHIHHVMQILSDGGGIYTLGRQPGSALRGNLIHDVPKNAGRAESNGMFLDEGTTDFVIEDNVIHDTARSPLRFHKATVNLVRNNVFALAPKVPLIRYNRTNARDIRQEGNTIVKAGGRRSTEGVLGRAALFDGSGSVEAPHDAKLEPDELTLEAWVKVTDLPAGQDSRRWVAGKNENEWVDGHYGLVIDGSGRIGAYLNIGGGQENCVGAWSGKGALATG
ncbi:MAG: right-handed parallel beta-helix repeat-containing protein, partial [Planctomycetota bacterium]